MKRREFIKNSVGAGIGTAMGAEKIESAVSHLVPPNPTSANSTPSTTNTVLSLPKGGGAVKGIGETFQPNPFAGSGNFTVPIYTSPGRGDMTPQLSLQYSTGNGNGPFGLGWSLSVPKIQRKTEKGIPVYDDTSDIFILSGAEDLVPYIENGQHSVRTETVNDTQWSVFRYRPRIEGLHALIEYWKPGSLKFRSAKSFWRIVSKDNITSIYGFSPKAKLNATERPEQIFQWQIELSYDAKGNCIWYTNKADEGLIRGDDKISLSESHRYNLDLDASPRIYNHYLKKIYYGNSTSLATLSFEEILEQIEQGFPEQSFFFKVLFDYGEHQVYCQNSDGTLSDHLQISDDIYQLSSAKWPVRKDAFSFYRSGFEIRTYRRCERVLMFHNIPEYNHPVLVRSTDFRYVLNEHNKMSMLESVVQRGYRRLKDGLDHRSEEFYLGGAGVVSSQYAIKSFPPIQFKYSSFEPEQQQFQAMNAEGNDMPSRALSNSDFALVDLYGSGLPGVVYSSPTDGYYYWENLGEGSFSRRKAIDTVPSNIKLNTPGIGFGDMAGNGQADLLVHNGARWGYFEAKGGGGWKNFTSYDAQPSFNIDDPQTRLFDIDGSGKAGALTTSEDSFWFFPCLGEKGFGNPVSIRRKFDLEVFPDVDFSNPRVKLADMTGDGLNDIVLVHSGRVDYWANLGRGKFSHRVTMESAPRLDQEFDPDRFILADIDGSGTADAIYIEHDRVRFWFNQSGNAWSDEYEIHGTPAVTDFDAVVSTDMLGSGTSGLLWTSDWPGVGRSNYRFLDFTGGVKPNLLIEMDNSMGATTRVAYRPSTFYYLSDQKRNRRSKWVSTLPFPVQCVDTVEQVDFLSGSKLVTRYAYHHGFYDGQEREFRGFAFVEQWDTESFDDFVNNSLFNEEVKKKLRNDEKGYYIPPVLTKTWYHTGAYNIENLSNVARSLNNTSTNRSLDMHELFRRDYYQKDQQVFRVDKSRFDFQDSHPDTLSLAEAWRALRGVVLRQEVFGLDGSDKEKHPYTVTESSYKIQLFQPRIDNKNSVYQVLPWEKLNLYYERIPENPRVIQKMTLKTDKYGNALSVCNLAYPSRDINAEPEQKKLLATYTESKFVNTSESNKQYRYIGIPYSISTFQLGGIENTFGLSTNSNVKVSPLELLEALSESLPIIPYHENLDESTLSKRLLTQTLTYFRKDDKPQEIEIPEGNPSQRTYNARLPLGQIGKIGLLYEEYKTTLEERVLMDLFGTPFSLAELRNLLLEQGGYVRLDDDPHGEVIWWTPSGQKTFDPDRFYQVVTDCDPWGNRMSFSYDIFSLLPLSTIDAIGNEVRVKNDYINLQPSTIRDPNHNGAKVAFDALGFVTASAIMGKLKDDFTPENVQEGDYLENFTPLWEYNAQYHAVIDAPYSQNPMDILQTGSTCTLYDLWRLVRIDNVAPPVVWSAAREIHKDNNTSVQQKLMYFDGLGRELQTKIEAEPDVNPPQQSPRWIASGWKIYNNKGEPVRQFEPFYTDNPTYENNILEGCSSTLFYDPLGRVICTIYPNNTFEKVLFQPWEQHSWDVNDTINLNPKTDFDIKGYTSIFLQNYQHCIDQQPFKTWKERKLGEVDVDDVDLNNPNTPADHAAVKKTIEHADTPTKSKIDSLGRIYLTEENNGSEGVINTRVKFDIQGNDLKITDPRNIESFIHRFDMEGRKLENDSKDAGKKVQLSDVFGQPVLASDANGNILYNKYDELRRQTELWIKVPGDDEFYLAVKTIYGEDKPNSTATNHRLKEWQVYDGAGLQVNEAYDFKGNLITTSRTLLNDRDEQVKWGQTQAPFVQATFSIHQNGKLDENYFFRQSSEFDALNRLVRLVLPDGTIQRPVYNKANLLKAVAVTLSGETSEKIFVTDIKYNAKGQREEIRYSNGVVTNYEYELDTFRLKHLTTERTQRTSDDNKLLQELHYTYDPKGNITEITDDAQCTNFYCNSQSDPKTLYTYDALYQLRKAEGREHIAMTACHYYNGNFKQSEYIPLPYQPVENGSALGNYRREYEYDDSGNLTEIKHTNLSTRNRWTRHQTFEQNSNRIIFSNALRPDESFSCSLEETFSNSNPNRIPHDANGNITKLPHLPEMIWNYRDELIEVVLNINSTTPENANRAFYQYDASGNRVRKYIKNGNKSEERIYLGSYEIYIEKGINSSLRRDSVNVMDNQQQIALVEVQRKYFNDKPLILEEGDNNFSPIASRIRFQLSNHLGSSVIEVSDSSQASIISYEEYYPYGGTSFIAGRNKAETSKKRYRYSGKEKDDETSLYYYGARYFAPWMGRWINPDPIGKKAGLNLFKFVRNNPIRLIDYDGTSDNQINSLEVRTSATSVTLDQLPEVNQTSDPPKSPADLYKEYSSEYIESIKRVETREELMDLLSQKGYPKNSPKGMSGVYRRHIFEEIGDKYRVLEGKRPIGSFYLSIKAHARFHPGTEEGIGEGFGLGGGTQIELGQGYSKVETFARSQAEAKYSNIGVKSIIEIDQETGQTDVTLEGKIAGMSIRRKLNDGSFEARYGIKNKALDLQSFAKVNSNSGVMEQGVVFKGKIADELKMEAKIGVGFQGLGVEDAKRTITHDFSKMLWKN